jgi:predicted site-specific integrase-resolvase
MYVAGGKAAKLLDISQSALRSWADNGRIGHFKLPNGDRRYKLDDIMGIRGDDGNGNVGNRKVIYCRVSTHGQKDDLGRQVELLKSEYPDYDVVTDIGSGLNFKRKGLRSLLERAMSRSLDEIVVSHKDRLARFAYDLLSWFFSTHGVKVVVREHPVETPEQELAEDLLAIVTVFACRSYGRRSHQTKRAKSKNEGADEGQTGSEQDCEDPSVSVSGGHTEIVEMVRMLQDDLQ